MEIQLKILPLLVLLLCCARAQSADTLKLTSKMFVGERQQIFVSDMSGWSFRKGHSLYWAAKNYDDSAWVKMKPTQLNLQYADKNGRVEGWFRVNFTIDSSLAGIPLGFRKGTWAAMDLYVDGKLLKSYGNTGQGALYQENAPFRKWSIAYPLQSGKVYTVAIHLVDYPNPLRKNKLKLQAEPELILRLVGPAHDQVLRNLILSDTISRSVIISISVLISLLLCSMVFVNRQEKHLALISLTAIFFSLSVIVYSLNENSKLSFVGMSIQEIINPLLLFSLFAWYNLVLMIIFELNKIRWLLLINLLVFIGTIYSQFSNNLFTELLSTLGNLLLGTYICLYNWKLVKGAKRAFAVGIMATFFSLAVVIGIAIFFPYISLVVYDYIFFLLLPMSLLYYVILRFKENLIDIQVNTSRIIQLSEEKKENAINQQKILEAEVSRQTEELRLSLETLRSTQAQLIQSEKLASLGELTAGIAHEIQNPLNFVNNFAEVSAEMLDEMEEELDKGDTQEVKAIAADLKQNLSKINHHGQRASAIVKGMLEHSRASTGVKEPTDLNALADEYLRLAYHGLRAKDNNFNATLETHFDPDLPKISVISQDIGRVLLNLINNAFYAVQQRTVEALYATSLQHPPYQPTVSVSTKRLENAVEIRVEDNGNGIPDAIKDKIFQPFFTTKPTGQGTGLGLSLAYDIVVKGHGGSLEIEPKEGKGTVFMIKLTINQ